MAKKYSPSFIHELPLTPELWQKNILNHRLDTGRQIYNACLNEALKRLGLMRESKIFKLAIKDYLQAKKNEDTKTIHILKDVFSLLRQDYGFTDAAIQSFAIKFRNKQFKTLTDSPSTQKIATRVFNAVNEYSFGFRGKPRFKSYGKLRSMEGKSNDTSIRFKDGKFIWGKLKINIKYDFKDKYGIEAHALTSNVKYCRLVVKDIRNKPRYFLQLILEGKPKIKHEELINKGAIVGIDLGPQTIAYVSEFHASLEVLASGIEKVNEKKIKVQKALSRKLRINNPDNFEPNFKKGKQKKLGKMKPKKERKEWVKSKEYTKLQNQYSDICRKEKEKRKEEHNKLINQLLFQGNIFHLEKLNYKSWQKMFGKSIGTRAPGLFMESLRRKVSNTGGNVYEFSTFKTALSQTCLCGAKKKKSLNTRWHICSCGMVMQRDLLPAYLSIFVNNDSLDLKKANLAFSGVEHSLVSAVQSLYGMSSSHLKILGIKRSEIESLVEKFSVGKISVVDDVISVASSNLDKITSEPPPL